MDSQAAPQRRLRKIRPKQATVKYGYGEQFEGTPEQAAAFQKAFMKELGYSPSFTYATSKAPKPSPRTRGSHARSTMSLPRARSREQSHAPRTTARSTPKAAQRSGDSGDSSDPPGAALAALFQLIYPFGGWTS